MKKLVLLSTVILALAGAGRPDTANAQSIGEPYCREYNTHVAIGGRMQNSYGSACLQPDGSWAMQSQSEEVYNEPVINRVHYVPPPAPVYTVPAPAYYQPYPYYQPSPNLVIRFPHNIVIGDNWGHGGWRGHDRGGHHGWDRGGHHGHRVWDGDRNRNRGGHNKHWR